MISPFAPFLTIDKPISMELAVFAWHYYVAANFVVYVGSMPVEERH